MPSIIKRVMRPLDNKRFKYKKWPKLEKGKINLKLKMASNIRIRTPSKKTCDGVSRKYTSSLFLCSLRKKKVIDSPKWVTTKRLNYVLTYDQEKPTLNECSYGFQPISSKCMDCNYWVKIGIGAQYNVHS